MTARGDLFDALFYARVAMEKLKPVEEQQAASSEWVREQQADIVQMLNQYDGEQAERVRNWGRRWIGDSASVFFVVADKLDPVMHRA
jgi:hypothetical protein